MVDLSGQTVLVTGGAGTGVGSGICEAVTAAGARLLINDIREAEADMAARRYDNAFAIPGDISQPEEVQRMFALIKESYGLVHGLVNNAGVGLTKPFQEVGVTEFERLYGINVKGLWMMSRAFVDQLTHARAEGCIVNVSSVHAKSTSDHYVLYASTKAAIEGLTRGMAVELGRFGVRCNAIGPGYVHAEQNYDLLAGISSDPHQWVETYRTEYQSVPSLVEARDCGNVVAFLLSDASRAVTGQVLYVDRGITSMLFARSFMNKDNTL